MTTALARPKKDKAETFCKRNTKRGLIQMIGGGCSLPNILKASLAGGVVCMVTAPVWSQPGRYSVSTNLKRIAAASIAYGDDYDERIPLSMSGSWKDLQNVHDNQLTTNHEGRANMWPLLIMPYLKDRRVLVDPTRKDQFGVFSGPPLAVGDKGYIATGRTFRTQNRLAFFGFNYQFLSPIVVPSAHATDANRFDFMVGTSRSFFSACNPHATVFFVPSTRYHLDKGDSRGFSLVNAPGMFKFQSDVNAPYVSFMNDTPCSGDWCGQDIDPRKPGKQTSEAAFYQNLGRRGNDVVFLDGHVKFLKTVQLAAGTDYLTAAPRHFVNEGSYGGAMIVDHSKYIWNLDDNFYGA